MNVTKVIFINITFADIYHKDPTERVKIDLECNQKNILRVSDFLKDSQCVTPFPKKAEVKVRNTIFISKNEERCSK